MNAATEYWTARALLEWQVEMGADEAMLDAPLDRFALAEAEAKPAVVAATPLPTRQAPPPVPVPPTAAELASAALSEAETAAARTTSLDELAQAQAGYDHCDLKKGARNFVFADGLPNARVMVVGEAPGREEDLEGRPFVGQAGQLLDRMFAAIGLSRQSSDRATGLYITNVLPWRTPGNRAPEPAEVAMMLPFLRRHIELAAPDFVVLMGNTPCQALLGRQGILRMRGQWAEVLGKPTLPMTHPAYLLRTPEAKREAWADLLSLKSRMGS